MHSFDSDFFSKHLQQLKTAVGYYFAKEAVRGYGFHSKTVMQVQAPTVSGKNLEFCFKFTCTCGFK